MPKAPLRSGHQAIAGADESRVQHLKIEVPPSPTNWVAVGVIVAAVIGVGTWIISAIGVIDGRIVDIIGRLSHLEGLIEAWRNPLPPAD